MSIKNNVLWVTISQGGKIVSQLLSLTVLTHLLSPSEYGLMAMAMVVTNFIFIIRDLGTAAAIIQRKELPDKLISTVFWLNFILGILVCFIVILFSGLISSIFNSPSLIPVLITISLSIPIASSSATHLALLERESRFRIIGIVELFSALGGVIFAIILAKFNAGVYSLVGQTLFTTIFSSLLFWRYSGWRPKKVFDTNELKKLLGFSGNLTVFNLINYFSRNADSIIIGHWLSSIVLGAYSLAYRVMLFPLQSLSFITTRSLYPLLSKSQDDILTIQNMYFNTVIIIASISAPIMAGLAILRIPFVHVVFGNQWLLVPSLLLWLAPTGFIQSIVSTSGCIFMSQGKTYLQMKLGAFATCLYLCAFFIGVQYDVQHMAQFYLYANIINMFLTMFYVLKIIHASIMPFIIGILRPIICSCLMCIGLFFLQSEFDEMIKITEWLFLVINIFIGVIVYTASYRIIFSRQFLKFLPKKCRILFLYS